MNIIVAVDRNFAIGNGNKLLHSIPEDMKMFREKTLGKTVVMGYNTLKSFPGGKPLKNRRSIVLSLHHADEIEGAEVCRDIGELFSLIGEDTDDVFVIGGSSVYSLLLDYCEYAYITEMGASFEADRLFPDLGDNWSLCHEGEERIEESTSIPYRFNVYKNSKVKKY